MNIGKENYDEVIELLGNLVENMEHKTIEKSYGSGCGTEYEYVEVCAIPEDDFDYDKMEELYKRLKSLRVDKIDSVLE